jgi:hypothetical protein
MQAQLDAVGGMVIPGSPAAFGRFIAEETEKWGTVIKSLGIKAD